MNVTAEQTPHLSSDHLFLILVADSLLGAFDLGWMIRQMDGHALLVLNKNSDGIDER